MKLVFPGGEFPQALLGPGVNRVGSDPDANIVIDRPGVLPAHCELHVTPTGVMLQVPHGTAVRVNDRDVGGVIALRPGDLVAFDRVQARLASIDAPARAHRGATLLDAVPEPANDDPAATAVRQVMPRYVLRGVSGKGFGRSFPVVGPTIIGRADDCTLRLDDVSLSRHHARLTPTDEGLLVEDLGSTNGCFIKGKRVQRGLLVPGDEVGFDALRFRLLAPGQAEPVQVTARPGPMHRSRAPRLGTRMSRWWWALPGLAMAGLAAAVAWVY